MSGRATVEVLGFPGCPNLESTLELVRRAAASVGVPAEIRVVDVESPDAAERLRFLGSPSVRVDGRDVEPGAQARDSFALACRVYETPMGRGGLPDESWVVAALARP